MSYVEKLALALTVAAQARGVKPSGRWIPRGVNRPTPVALHGSDVTRRWDLTPEEQREPATPDIAPTAPAPSLMHGASIPVVECFCFTDRAVDVFESEGGATIL